MPGGVLAEAGDASGEIRRHHRRHVAAIRLQPPRRQQPRQRAIGMRWPAWRRSGSGVSHATCACAHVAASARSGSSRRARSAGRCRIHGLWPWSPRSRRTAGSASTTTSTSHGQQARRRRQRRTVGPRAAPGASNSIERKEVRLGVAGPGRRRHAQHLSRLDGQHVARPGQRQRAGDVARRAARATRAGTPPTRAPARRRWRRASGPGARRAGRTASRRSPPAATAWRVHFRSTAPRRRGDADRLGEVDADVQRVSRSPAAAAAPSGCPSTRSSVSDSSLATAPGRHAPAGAAEARAAGQPAAERRVLRRLAQIAPRREDVGQVAHLRHATRRPPAARCRRPTGRARRRPRAAMPSGSCVWRTSIWSRGSRASSAPGRSRTASAGLPPQRPAGRIRHRVADHAARLLLRLLDLPEVVAPLVGAEVLGHVDAAHFPVDRPFDDPRVRAGHRPLQPGAEEIAAEQVRGDPELRDRARTASAACASRGS